MKAFVKIIPLPLLKYFESLALSSYSGAKFLVTHSSPDFFEEVSKKKAVDTFKHAAKNVPAYKDFLKKNKIDINNIKKSAHFDMLVPETNKINYIKKYNYEQRCFEGKFPKRGNIDESSGTSGKPTNWIRSVSEEQILFKAAKFEFNYIFDSDNKDYIVLSAWSTGPWATGVKFCTIVEHFCLVKNTDANVENIIETLKTFGNNYNYIISGYPPFIKHLVDEGKKKINWKDYNIDILTGGEGVILKWRDYISKHLKSGAKIVSSYGASDIDIGIGFETPFSLDILRLCANNKKLREALFGHHEKMPMLFQYNPMLHHITNHVNKEGSQEFQVTLLDNNVVSPKIKYNLHDEGGAIKHNDMISLLEKHEPAFAKKMKGMNNILKLPFLHIVGRSDGTISLDGANVYPHQVELCLHSHKKLLESTRNFKIGAEFDKKKNINFNIKIELKKGVKPNKNLETLYHNVILNKLMEINGDFKESYMHDESIINPRVHLLEYGHKLFRDNCIKNKYIE